MVWLLALILLIGALAISALTRDGFVDYITPAEASLDKPRDPYALLSLPTKPYPQIAVGPTAEQCYSADFQNSLSVEPSFRQMTNNYRHKNGESCSALNHDLILGIYA
jgi:hypothetical protein